jgi:Dickkopf-like protein
LRHPVLEREKTEAIMSTSTISARLSDGLRQQMYAEPTVVEETCQVAGDDCWWDSECCPGMICEWFHCKYA